MIFSFTIIGAQQQFTKAIMISSNIKKNAQLNEIDSEVPVVVPQNLKKKLFFFDSVSHFYIQNHFEYFPHQKSNFNINLYGSEKVSKVIVETLLTN